MSASSRPITAVIKQLSLGTLRQWHWISSAVCLVGMLGFAITGITLNHAASIPASLSVTSVEGELPAEVLAQTMLYSDRSESTPLRLRRWFASEHGVALPLGQAEWSEDELYVAMPRPGGDAWLSVDLGSGEFIYERTDRGWVAYFNDLHKGRDSGTAWSWFIDIFAAACVVFSLTGLLLLQRQAAHRPGTWPAVALGVLIPFLLILFFIH